jgi:hypothetical protein
VIENWIEMNKKPTPNPSREGNLIEKDLIKNKNSTPCPSGEGNLI